MMCTAAAPRGLTARITWGYEVSIHNQMSERPRGWKGWGVGGGGVGLGVSSTTLQKMHVKSQIIKNKCKTHKCNDT